MVGPSLEEIRKRVLAYRKQYARCGQQENKFAVGDLVWYENPMPKGGKLMAKRVGPAEVVGCDFRSYILKMPDGRIIRTHEKRLAKKEFVSRGGRVLDIGSIIPYME